MATPEKLSRRAALALIAPAVGALVSWTGCARAPKAPDVALLETPLWRTAGALLLRAEEAAEQRLLLWHFQQGRGYRYEPRQRTLIVAKQADWDAANTPVRDCSTAAGDAKGLWVDPTLHRLRDGARILPTAGAHALSLHASPSGGLAAVLSAEGPATKSLFPFLGGGGANGRHYHQLLRTEDRALVGPALRLSFDSSREVILGCWSPDERFIVYYDYFMTHLSVVHLNATGKRNSTDGNPRK